VNLIQGRIWHGVRQQIARFFEQLDVLLARRELHLVTLCPEWGRGIAARRNAVCIVCIVSLAAMDRARRVENSRIVLLRA
jgi:hypothetical protein